MTTASAREILGMYASTLSDEQVNKIIDSLNVLLEIGFKQLEPKPEEFERKETLKCQKIEPIMKL